MFRIDVRALGLVAVLAAGCGSSSTSTSPTSPTATSPSPAPAPSPSPTPSPSGGCPVPSTPANLVATTAISRATLTWSASTNVRDYEVQIGTTPGSGDRMFTNTTITTFQWNGVSPGTYYARVDARNACGTSPSSNIVAFTISGGAT